MAVKSPVKNHSSVTASTFIRLDGVRLSLRDEDIIQPKEKISIKELLNRATKVAKMDVFKPE